jgi:hypothetical protein
LIIVTIIGALAIACGSDDVSEPTSPTTSAGSQNLIDNQALWSAAGIDNYEFVYQRICFCPPEYTTPALIEVRDGAVWSVEYQDSEIHLDAPDTTMFPMITALFDVLTEAHDRNAVKVTVTFSADLGYPEDVDIDYAANIADDELSFTVTEFVRK